MVTWAPCWPRAGEAAEMEPGTLYVQAPCSARTLWPLFATILMTEGCSCETTRSRTTATMDVEDDDSMDVAEMPPNSTRFTDEPAARSATPVRVTRVPSWPKFGDTLSMVLYVQPSTLRVDTLEMPVTTTSPRLAAPFGRANVDADDDDRVVAV